jgi:hypothetical protein
MCKLSLAIPVLGIFISSCTMNNKEPDTIYKKGSFGYDLSFLQQYDSVVVLQDGDAQIIVSPRYQAKVFTSTADGLEAKSFGWVNYSAFSGDPDAHMNAYGGENRLWLGPEGGRFSLFFRAGDSMTFDNWKTPAAFDTEPWNVVSRSEQSVEMQKDMQLENYSGTPLTISATRTVSILNSYGISNLLQMGIDTSAKVVGYTTLNAITNKGKNDWNEVTGMPCIWILDMLNPSPGTVIILPYQADAVKDTNEIATTNYFGEISKDRLRYKQNTILFKADGKSRGKIGLRPATAKPVAGSYDPENGMLTITIFDIDRNGLYLNQVWGTKAPPFTGDAVNAYNDGPLEDGSQMGPFYEIESVSPAALLRPGETLRHRHSVIHITGDQAQLDNVSRQVLGISISDITSSF